MSDTYVWYRVAHLASMALWVGGIAAVMMSMHLAPMVAPTGKAAAVAKTRRAAMGMELGSVLTIALGLLMAFTKARWGGQTAFTTGGWLHAKLGLVVLGVLLPHVVLRVRLGRWRRDTSGAEAPALPAWLTPLFITAVLLIIVIVANPTLMRK